MKTTFTLCVFALSALISTISAETIVHFNGSHGYLGTIDTVALTMTAAVANVHFGGDSTKTDRQQIRALGAQPATAGLTGYTGKPFYAAHESISFDVATGTSAGVRELVQLGESSDARIRFRANTRQGSGHAWSGMVIFRQADWLTYTNESPVFTGNSALVFSITQSKDLSADNASNPGTIIRAVIQNGDDYYVSKSSIGANTLSGSISASATETWALWNGATASNGTIFRVPENASYTSRTFNDIVALGYYFENTDLAAGGAQSRVYNDVTNFSVALIGEGQTYHVRTEGSDVTGDGSSTNPWATLKHACANVPADQRHTIRLGPGTFTDTDRKNAGNTPAILPRNVSLIGAGKTLTTYIGQINVLLVNDQVICDFFIDGRENTAADSSLFSGLMIEKGNKLVVRDLRIEGFHSMGLQFGRYDGLSGSKLHNCELVNNGRATSRGFGMRTGNMVNCEMHDNTFLEERGKGGEPWNSGNRTFTNVKIFNNTFKTHKDKAAGWNNQEVFNFELWRVDCLNVEVFNNRFDGSISLIDPASPRTSKSPYSIRLHHNRWDYTIRYGIEAGMAYLHVDSNYFHFGISTDPDKGGAYGGIVYFSDKKHDHIRIHHNVFENFPLYAIHNLTGDHVKIYNNTAIAGRSGEIPSYWEESTPRFLTLGRTVTRSNLIMANNIFYADEKRPGTFMVQDTSTPNPVLSQIQSNVIWNAVPGMIPSLLALADIDGPKEHNPLFVKVGDKPDPYYSLSANSPLIDGGMFLEGLHTGYWGTAPDIGAVAFKPMSTLVREGLLPPVPHLAHIYTRAYDLRGRLIVSDKMLPETAIQAATPLIWDNGQGNRKKDLMLR